MDEIIEIDKISRLFTDFPTLENKVVRIVGRMGLKKTIGEHSYATINGADGSIQIEVRRRQIGDIPYDYYKRTEAGQLVIVTGRLYSLGDIGIFVMLHSLELFAVDDAYRRKKSTHFTIDEDTPAKFTITPYDNQRIIDVHLLWHNLKFVLDEAEAAYLATELNNQIHKWNAPVKEGSDSNG